MGQRGAPTAGDSLRTKYKYKGNRSDHTLSSKGGDETHLWIPFSNPAAESQGFPLNTPYQPPRSVSPAQHQIHSLRGGGQLSAAEGVGLGAKGVVSPLRKGTVHTAAWE